MLAFVPAAVAGLNPATEKGWEEYVGSARAQTKARLGPTACFLWSDENASRVQRLRAGEILVVPADGGTPSQIPGGLIHHWLGAVFIANVTLPEVLATLRDYSHYPNFYPTVVKSKLVSRDGLTDHFASLERHKALFSRIGLDADFSATYYYEAGSKRAYSIASTTRLQQIQNFGGSHQHELEPDAPKAYLWRLSTITRYLERDGGVYMELEGMALSRNIPPAFRWVVEPFVRQAAEDAVVTSLKESRQAILQNSGRRPENLTSGAVSFREQ